MMAPTNRTAYWIFEITCVDDQYRTNTQKTTAAAVVTVPRPETMRPASVFAADCVLIDKMAVGAGHRPR